MLARLIKDKKGEMCILCSDGTIIAADKNALNILLSGFNHIEKLGNGNTFWNKEFPEMSLYPGYEFACVTDTYQLLLSDFSPFKDLFEVDTSVSNMITATEYAKLHGKSTEQIKVFCRNGRILGATKIGRDWMIPANAPYPIDKRFSFTGNK